MYLEHAYALFRIVFGVLFLIHGLQKFDILAGGFALPAQPLILIAGIIEVIGGLLIALGLFTVPAAFVSSGLMAAAYFMAHFPKAFLPISNGGEPAVLFCFAFLYMVFVGSGKYSIDAMMKK
jgi:putative oxidoreductase